MMTGMPTCYCCIQGIFETDLTEDLKKIDVPILILHGDDDQIVPNRCLGHAFVENHREPEPRPL